MRVREFYHKPKACQAESALCIFRADGSGLRLIGSDPPKKKNPDPTLKNKDNIVTRLNIRVRNNS